MKRKERDDGARPKAAKRLAGKATSRNRSAAAAARSVGTEDGIEARLPDETAAGGLGGTRGGDKPKAIPGEKNVGGMNTKRKKKKAEKVAKASGGEVPAVVGQIGQVDQHSSSMKRELGGSPKPKKKKLKHGALQPDKQEASQACAAMPREQTPATEELPFPVQDDDHCETPAEAYQHLAPVLDLVCRELGVAGREKLRIYDPYFCAGSMREHLGALGFRNVHNRPDNFYHVVETGCIPAFDVLITNPPYSGNHVSELLRIVVKLAKPFFLLMPNWVYTKVRMLRSDQRIRRLADPWGPWGAYRTAHVLVVPV